MSAIWGAISFENDIPIQIDGNMRKPYEKKCRLDRIQTCMQEQCYMACGIQHVTNLAKMEILPLYDQERGCLFTADCLLDNREQLLEELTLQDDTIPDGQLMYEAYRKWGMECLNHFRGLFSMAVYEKRDKVLYLAVDQVASRCLYYYRKGDMLTFSTLIEPIRACFPEISINNLYIKDFLTAPGMLPNIVSAETPYYGIYKLNPGTYLRITDKEINEVSYWNPRIPLKDCCCKNASEYGSYFRKLYEQCVQDALRTQGEVGIAMSSGLDSASVGVLAAEQLAKEKKKLHSYTYVPSENDITDSNRHHVLDEKQDVGKIVERYPNISAHFLTNHGKNCYEELDKCLEIMEIPVKASVNLPNLCEIYEQAHEAGCLVVLSGQAGNSTVSHGYIDDVLYDLYSNKKYIRFLAYLNRYSKVVEESRKQAVSGCRRYFQYADKVRKRDRLEYQPGNPFLHEKILEDYPLQERYAQGEIFCLDSIPVEQSMYRSLLYKKAVYTYLGEMETKLGLAYNLILRDPTKDMRLLQFCYHIPYSYFAYQGTPRWLIRGNMQDMLPDSLLNDWMRYGVQNSDWFLRMMRDWETLEPKIRECLKQPRVKQYMDEETVEKFLHEITQQKPQEAEKGLQYLLFLCAVGRFVER